MKLNSHNPNIPKEFLKTRVKQLEQLGLPVGMLLEKGILTARGIVNRQLECGLDISSKQVKLIEASLNKQLSNIETDTRINRIVQKNNNKPKPVIDLSDEDDIIQTFAVGLGTTKKALIGKSRKKDIVHKRDIVIFLLRKYGDMSFPAIGNLLGGRNHATIIHAYNKFNKAIIESREFTEEFLELILDAKTIKTKKRHLKKVLPPEMVKSAKHQLKTYKKISKRDIKILKLYREGLTLENIGTTIGVSRERIRQIVKRTIQQIAINDSLEKGIDINPDILIEEESKKRKIAKNSGKNINKIDNKKEKRWSKFYMSCTECGSISYKHIRNGLCEQCIGQFRGETREKIIQLHNNRCDSCGVTREQARMESGGNDLYISKKAKSVLCQKCFRQKAGSKLGGYKNYQWSRLYEQCKQCGTTSIPHFKYGLCKNCSPYLTSIQRDNILKEHGEKCDICNIKRSRAINTQGRDLYITKRGYVLCRKCFMTKRSVWGK